MSQVVTWPKLSLQIILSGACSFNAMEPGPEGRHHRTYHSFVYTRLIHESLARYVKLGVVHAPGMPGTFSRDARVVMCAGIANYRFPLKSVAENRSRDCRRMRTPQFYVSVKRPMVHKGKM